MRGTLLILFVNLLLHRITPAHAGNTFHLITTLNL